MEHRGIETPADALHSISSILQTGLDKRTTSVLVELLERGVDPGSLADVIVEVRQQAKGAPPDNNASLPPRRTTSTR